MAYQHALQDDEKGELLRIARASLKEWLNTGRIPPGAPHRKSMNEIAAVFVTLNVLGELRGCIGGTTAEKPLYKAIQEMTIAAASKDTRFDKITVDDLPDLVIEISVIGEEAPVDQATDIEIGTHGLRIEGQGKDGLLLPHVATQAGWDGPAFVNAVCEKASLPPAAWQADDVQLFRFTAQVFDERSNPPPVFRLGRVRT